jgi:hypothetical protein
LRHMPSSYGRGVAAVVFVLALTFSPYAHAADTTAVGINDPFTDTLQLWSALLNVIDSVAYQLGAGLQSQSSWTFDRSPQQQTPKTVRPSFAASAVLATQSLPETATTSGSASNPPTNPKQPPAKSLPETSLPTIYASPTFAAATATSAFVTQDQFNNALSVLGASVQQLLARTNTNPVPEYVAGGGNATNPYAAASAINQLSNVTITNPTITGLSASAIPDLSGSYLSLGGGTLTGAFVNSGTASSSFAGALGIGTTSPSDTFALNGAAYFADITAPSVTTNRLYSNSGSLYWAGSLIGGGGVGNWTSSGGNVYRASGNVGVGTTSPSFSPDVNGIVAGQVYDRGGAVYNVKAYSAKGNGSTDDWQAFENAIAAASAAGGSVYVPPSSANYVISRALQPLDANGNHLDNVDIEVSPAATIECAGNASGGGGTYGRWPCYGCILPGAPDRPWATLEEKIILLERQDGLRWCR